MNRIAIIVAGGKGLRMGKEIPKQFLLLNNLPILMHTIQAFDKAGIKVVLVLPEDNFEFWNDLCAQYNFDIDFKLVAGGDARFNSVQNGLSVVDNNCLVAIHDGVRPLLSQDLINRLFEEAEKKGNAIPCIDVTDSLRIVENNSNTAVDRAKYKSIQTPQVFKSELILDAYSIAVGNKFTDDASVLEAEGAIINLVEGEESNIKITTEKDLLIAKILIENK